MKNILPPLALLLIANIALADAPTQPAEDKELSDLLAVLQKDTEVATKTRLNSDYVPGIVTVLEGSKLEAMGVGTAWEALGLVPGMQAIMDPRGLPSVIVRGLDFPFNNGNIQILINSVPMTRADAGMNSPVLLMPVEQIERIEVIRGPGSVIYGDFAFMGLVNIITRREGERVYGRGELRMRTAGAEGSVQTGMFMTSASAAHAWSDNTPVMNFHNVPERRWFGAASLEGAGLSVNLQTVSRTFDPTGAGGLAALVVDDSTWTIDGRYSRELAPKLRAEARLTYLNSDDNGGITIFAGHLTKAAINLMSDRWAGQSWLLGADATTSTIDHASFASPPRPGQPVPPPQQIASGIERRVLGLTLQDRIDVREKISITLGARYDHYSDLDSRITPRAAVVWRLGEHHIVKGQYAEGFRPPTFFELYSPPLPGIVPRYPFEVNATTELNYVFKGTGQVGRATIFRTTIRDMIRPGGFVTPGKARATGQELEWEQQVSATLKVDANVSHVTTADPRIIAGRTVPDPAAAKWLGNLGLLYEPLSGMLVAAHWTHVGDRDAASGYDVGDFTVSRENVFLRGLGIRAGIKNAFDHEVDYVTVLPTGVLTFPWPGRTVWAQVSWKR